ncbi:MAG: helix-turn-helix transcriptional regulator [Candidatus Eremiobacteraeota bacterium]|nr:helix-turn-helix transcriptional regulator [Candidatus Eremiobacteraeota bacterium]MCW5869056.1 helix-turn-helix transcriptional regulator [Candidatus Eremiobacteraeota bacterium]
MRLARQERQLSQTELAERIKIHRATLIRWESNLSAPTPEQEELLGRALGRRREWFHGEPPATMLNEDTLTLDEKMDVLLRRVGRVERRLELMTEMLQRLSGDLSPK